MDGTELVDEFATVHEEDDPPRLVTREVGDAMNGTPGNEDHVTWADLLLGVAKRRRATA